MGSAATHRNLEQTNEDQMLKINTEEMSVESKIGLPKRIVTDNGKLWSEDSRPTGQKRSGRSIKVWYSRLDARPRTLFLEKCGISKPRLTTRSIAAHSGKSK